MITPEEQVLLDRHEEAKQTAIKTQGDPCTPQAHTAVVSLLTHQSDLIVLSYNKSDKMIDNVNAFMEKYSTKVAPPKTWNDLAKVFILKAPVPFALIVVAVIFWFMYSNVKPKEVIPAIGKEVVEHIEEER